MAWNMFSGNPRNMRPLEGGFGGGGRYYRPIAPQRLYPDTTRPRHGAPDAPRSSPIGDRVTPPMNRGYPTPYQRPKGRNKRRGPQESYTFYELMREWFQPWPVPWMAPQSPGRIPTGTYHPAGWWRCGTPLQSCHNTHAPPDKQKESLGAALLCGNPQLGNCPTNQVIAGTVPINSPLAVPTNKEIWWLRTNTAGNFAITDRWWRETNTAAIPLYRRGRVVLPAEFASPGDDPFPFPEKNGEKYYGNNQVGAVGQAGLITRGRPIGGTRPIGQPDPDVQYPPPPPGPGVPAVNWPGGGGPGRPGTHVPAPPAPGDKEKKEPPFDYGAAGKVYGALTEGGDVAKCYIDAKGGDSAGLGTRGAFKEAWKRANDPSAPPLDGGKFMACLAAAQAQDKAIGKLSNATAKAQNRNASKRPGGYRGGGWGTRMH